MRKSGRATVCILVLSLLLLPLSARILDISYITLNDAMTVGIAQNADDLRSYGALLTFAHSSGFLFQIEAAGLTMRDSLDAEGGSRYDELLFDGGYAHTFSFPVSSVAADYRISGSLGFVLAGNLGFQSVQNTWHEISDIPLVDLPYCQGDVLTWYPRLVEEQRLSFSFPVPWFQQTSGYVSVSQAFAYAVGYGYDLSIQSSLGQKAGKRQNLSLGIGYDVSRSLDEVPLHEKIAESESGVYLHLDGRMGIIEILMRAHLSSGTGWGGVGFHVTSPERELSGAYADDFSISIGLTAPQKAMALSVSYDLNDRLRLLFSNSFDDYILGLSDNSRQNISWWQAGVQWHPFTKERWLFSPFGSLTAGFRRVSVFSDDLSLGRRMRDFDAFTPLVNAEAGILLFSDGRVQMQGISYGLECAAGLLFSPSEHLQESVELYSLEAVNTYETYVRIGLSMSGAL